MRQVIRLDSGVHTLHEVTAADKKYIENLYEDVKKTIQKKMTALGIRNNPDTAVSDSLKKFQLRELEKSIDRDLAEIRTSTQAHIIGSMSTISQAVAQSNADWLASLGLNFSFSVASVPPDVVANLVSGKVYADNWQFSKRIWGDYRSSKGDVSNIVARGIAENKSAFEIAQDLEKYVSPSAAKPWDWSKVYPGCKKKIDYNAQRLARTLSAHAYQQSVIETAKRNPFTTRVEWHSAMVERTCPICEARNGQIYELGKVPMDHPNGLCCIYPVLDKSLEDISNILADWVNGEGDADMNGRIDKYISYLGYDPGKVAADTLKAGSILKGLEKIGGTPAGSASNVYAGISENTLTNNNKSGNIIVGTTDNFNRKTSLYTSSEDLKATNPNFSTGEYKWTNNCQRCAPTYEMRRRGFNVTALPLPCSNVEDDLIARNCFSVWNNISIRSFSTKDDVINAMSKWGDGARAQIRVTFQNNKGHTFIAEQRGTNTVFIDPQTGSEDCESIFESAIPNGIFARIDNASVNQDIIGLCCK